MYVQAVAQYLLKENLVKGKKWYSLTADYAFGHDLLKVAKMFMEKNGGQFAADELIPTDISDFSPFLLKIRQARPDIVISNLAGNQITNFLKQYSEYGLQFPVVGFAFDTAVAWGLGKGNFSGVWPLVWHHLVDTPTSKAYVEKFTKKYGKPPENQSWGDYNSLKIVAQSMAEMKSTDPIKLAEHLRKGAKFDVMKSREGYFRAYDNQMMMEMYAVRAKEAAKMKDQWDIYDAARHRAGAGRRPRESSRRRRGRATSGDLSFSLLPACGERSARREARRVRGTREAAESRPSPRPPSPLRPSPRKSGERETTEVGLATHLHPRAGAQRPAHRRLLPADRARPVADLLARRHRQSGARRVLCDRRVSRGRCSPTASALPAASSPRRCWSA